MMLNFKDRKPASAGSRSFSLGKIYVIILTVILLALYWYATRMVVAVLPEGKREPFAFTTHPGDEWNISFTHSVEKTEWDEYFRVNDVHDMVLTHTRFESLGWGFPYSTVDGKLRHTDDGKFILEMNRPYRDVALRISEQAMQEIVHGKDRYDLIAMYGQGTAVQIKALYRYQYWLEIYF